jgi:hypothetical protein
MQCAFNLFNYVLYGVTITYVSTLIDMPADKEDFRNDGGKSRSDRSPLLNFT